MGTKPKAIIGVSCAEIGGEAIKTTPTPQLRVLLTQMGHFRSGFQNSSVYFDL